MGVCVPGPQKHFLGPCRKRAMFKYRDEHPSILEDIFIVVTCCKETAKKLFEHRIEACGHTYFGVCVCSLSRGSAMYSYQSSLSLTDFRTFQDQTHFPRLSRSWKFYKHDSRTFREAREPCRLISTAFDESKLAREPYALLTAMTKLISETFNHSSLSSRNLKSRTKVKN